MRVGTELVRMFEDANFRLVRWSGKHYIWACPCGHTQLTQPVTPGQGRSRCKVNTKGDIARTLRVCNQQERKAA